MEKKKNGKIRIAITVLAILLAVSLVSLAGTLVYRHFFADRSADAVVPDNIIASDTAKTQDAPASDTDDTYAEETNGETAASAISGESENADGAAASVAPETSGGESASANVAVSGNESVSGGESTGETRAPVLSLYDRNPGDNVRFEVKNMFPGDSETKYYCVRVSHKGDVTLRFNAEIQPGGEILAQVLKCRIALPESGEVLYDGLMKDMPASVNHKLAADSATVSEVYYKITVYLDTETGNEYMNKSLLTDFKWWVEETENLTAPQTGDSIAFVVWLCIASGSAALLIVLLKKRSKEEQTDGR